MSDRHYDYLATVWHSDTLARPAVIDRLTELALPTWRRLVAETVLRNVRVLAKIGDVELKTDSPAVRDWDYLVLAEVGAGATAADAEAAEWAELTSTDLTDDHELIPLSREILRRPARSGLAVPRPSPLLPTLPVGFTYGVEYIDIPTERWRDYQDFMRDVFGPVGARMVEHGQAYQVIITERVTSLFHDPSLPDWNRVHVLVSDFDHEPGFFTAATEAVRAIQGGNADVREALSAVDDYRRKPRMSKNLIIDSLSVGPP